MALPSLSTAKYELTLPSTGEKVEFRPFLVKEEKVLMLAQQAGDTNSLIRAVGDIVEACTFNKLVARDIPFFDIEYVFLQLRARSIGEKTQITVTCPDDGETQVSVEVNMNDVKCIKNEEHTNKIQLTDSIGVIMEYPKMAQLMNMDDSDETKAAFDIVKNCVGQIYDSENVYVRNDMDEKELNDFIESMSHTQFAMIQKFFDTMPRIKHTVEVKNPKTGVKSNVILQGLQSFFQ